MIQFYCPDIETSPVLPESDSRHCVKVLRMEQGEELEIVDGKGHRFLCRLIDAHPKRALVEIIGKTAVGKSWRGNITIAVAPTKHLDRMEWLVEKLTETGVDAVVPLQCQRSERRDLKQERLEKIAVSAMKQSLKATLPRIEELTPFGRALDDAVSRGDAVFFAHCDREADRRLLSRSIPAGGNVTVFIGPEGDFSPAEVEQARRAGCTAVSLGDCRLRTETAALTACTTFQVVGQMA